METLRPLQLIGSVKSSINYYVFASCANTQVSKRLFEDHDGFALKQLKNKAFNSIWKTHFDEKIESEKRKETKIQ